MHGTRPDPSEAPQPFGEVSPSGNRTPACRACFRQLYNVAAQMPSCSARRGIDTGSGGIILRITACLRSSGYFITPLWPPNVLKDQRATCAPPPTVFALRAPPVGGRQTLKHLESRWNGGDNYPDAGGPRRSTSPMLPSRKPVARALPRWNWWMASSSSRCSSGANWASGKEQSMM